jgi:hypothetical protein
LLTKTCPIPCQAFAARNRSAFCAISWAGTLR